MRLTWLCPPFPDGYEDHRIDFFPELFFLYGFDGWTDAWDDRRRDVLSNQKITK